MTDGERLTAIFDRLSKIDRDLAQHSALMTGELARVGDRLEGLDERVRIQNGRVTKLEGQMGEMQIHARIHDNDAAEDEAKAAVISARVWAALTGSFLVILGAVIGYFL